MARCKYTVTGETPASVSKWQHALLSKQTRLRYTLVLDVKQLTASNSPSSFQEISAGPVGLVEHRSFSAFKGHRPLSFFPLLLPSCDQHCGAVVLARQIRCRDVQTLCSWADMKDLKSRGFTLEAAPKAAADRARLGSLVSRARRHRED